MDWVFSRHSLSTSPVHSQLHSKLEDATAVPVYPDKWVEFTSIHLSNLVDSLRRLIVRICHRTIGHCGPQCTDG